MDGSHFDLGCESTTRLVAIIIIVIVYYICTFLAIYKFGAPAFLIAFALPYPLLFFFMRGYCDRDVSRWAYLFFLACLLAAALFLVFIALYRFSGSKWFAFLITLVTWLIVGVAIVAHCKRNGIQ